MNPTLQKSQISEFVFNELQKTIGYPLTFFHVYKNLKGTRFTTFGYERAKKIWQAYIVKLPQGYKTKNRTLLMLDERVTWPYYLTQTKLVLFNEMDAFEFGLYQGDINLWANKS
jgi:hypothetical protein